MVCLREPRRFHLLGHSLFKTTTFSLPLASRDEESKNGHLKIAHGVSAQTLKKDGWE
jgi:hypothetical protein